MSMASDETFTLSTYDFSMDLQKDSLRSPWNMSNNTRNSSEVRAAFKSPEPCCTNNVMIFSRDAKQPDGNTPAALPSTGVAVARFAWATMSFSTMPSSFGE
jgi:hypothetical protein